MLVLAVQRGAAMLRPDRQEHNARTLRQVDGKKRNICVIIVRILRSAAWLAPGCQLARGHETEALCDGGQARVHACMRCNEHSVP